MNETITLYRKTGRRYVKQDDYLNEKGLPCGLYLFYKPNHKGEHSEMMNMIHYAKVHEIKDVGNFADLFVKNEEKVKDIVHKSLEKFGNGSISDIAIEIIAKISEL